MASALAFIGGGLLEGVGKGLAETGKQKREAVLKRLEEDRAQERTLELEEVKQKNRGLLQEQSQGTGQTNALALKAAPGPPPAADRTLVEIGDDTSPTGTTFVSRADAIGEPGKPTAPPTPLAIERNYD